MKSYSELGTEIGELVERKNAAYGSSIDVGGKILALLYEDGLKPEQYDDVLLVARIVDKLKRVATDRDAFGESPFMDIAGYGILGAHMHQQKEDNKEWLDNASGQNATNSSQDKSAKQGSVAPHISAKTTTSASEKSAPVPSQPQKSCCDPLTSAPVATATEAAAPSVEDQLNGVEYEILGVLSESYPSFVDAGFVLQALAQRGVVVSYGPVDRLDACKWIESGPGIWRITAIGMSVLNSTKQLSGLLTGAPQ